MKGSCFVDINEKSTIFFTKLQIVECNKKKNQKTYYKGYNSLHRSYKNI